MNMKLTSMSDIFLLNPYEHKVSLRDTPTA